MKVYVARSFPLFVALACAAITYSAQAQDVNGHLYIAHAASGRNISGNTNPEYPVDISVGSSCLAQGVVFGDIRGPFTSSPGSYPVKVTVSDFASPCKGTAVLSTSITLVAGDSTLGILTLNGSNQVSGKLTELDLGPVPTGQARVIVANTTQDNLTGKLTAGDSTTVRASENIAAGAIVAAVIPSAEYSATFYPEGSTTIATGPLELDIAARNVYVIVLAGSTANNSVQVVGPRAFKDVL